MYDKENNKLETYPADTKYASSVGTGRKTTASEKYTLNSNYIEFRNKKLSKKRSYLALKG